MILFQIVNAFQALMINAVLVLDIKMAKLLWHFDPCYALSNALLVLTLLTGLKKKAKQVSRDATNDFEKALK